MEMISWFGVGLVDWLVIDWVIFVVICVWVDGVIVGRWSWLLS